ncbi:hypothetical protein ACLB2K_064093 [Fragaria x ananassa]
MVDISDSHIEPRFEIEKELFPRTGIETFVAHAVSVVTPILHADAASALEILKNDITCYGDKQQQNRQNRHHELWRSPTLLYRLQRNTQTFHVACSCTEETT